jgi:hypothetical protein
MVITSAVTDAIADGLKSVAGLAAAMTVVGASGTPVVRITPFHYLLGQENRLAEAVYAMPAPSMLVAWEGSKGGDFDGQTIWKHRWGVYYRMGNAAGIDAPVGYEDLWGLT